MTGMRRHAPAEPLPALVCLLVISLPTATDRIVLAEEPSQPPLPVQRQMVERVARRREEIARLKADAKARADAAKADLEAMILGTGPVE